MQHDDYRKNLLYEVDKLHRNAVMYAAAHGSNDSLELLSAADAPFYTTDKYHRTAMHYAALNNTSRTVEVVFLGFKALGQAVKVYG
jgi:ankyrin repeat protein